MNVQPLRIIHPTDFSPTSHRAFWHALKLAVATRGDLILLHLEAHKIDEPHWKDFPHVRETLQAWGLLQQGAKQADVTTQLGIQVAKFDIYDQDIGHGIEVFTQKYGGDLLVLGTEGRKGLSRWIAGSKAEAIMRTAKISTLFIPAHGDGFVDGRTGTVSLGKIVAPVDHQPSPELAIRELVRVIGPLGLPEHGLHLVHAGEDAPVIRIQEQHDPAPVHCLGGPVIHAILEASHDADLIAMVTAGRHGLLDGLRGSTTEQIIRQAHCPVLAIPTR